MQAGHPATPCLITGTRCGAPSDASRGFLRAHFPNGVYDVLYLAECPLDRRAGNWHEGNVASCGEEVVELGCFCLRPLFISASNISCHPNDISFMFLNAVSFHFDAIIFFRYQSSIAMWVQHVISTLFHFFTVSLHFVSRCTMLHLHIISRPCHF